MSTLSTPDFPIISYKVNIPATITFDVTYNSITHQGSIPAGDYWGFATFDLGVAATTSLMGILADTVEEVLQTDFSVANVTTGKHTWDDTNNIRGNQLFGYLETVIISPLSSVLIDNFSSGEEFFGLLPGGSITITFAGNLGRGYTEFDTAGYFAPNNLTVYDDRTYKNTVYSSVPASGGTTSLNSVIVRWGQGKTFRALTFPIVPACQVFEYRRADQDFSAPYQINMDNPNNLLQNLWNAASGNRLISYAAGNAPEFRIYAQNGAYRRSVIVDQNTLMDMESMLSDVVEGRLYKVTIPFIDISSVGGAG